MDIRILRAVACFACFAAAGCGASGSGFPRGDGGLLFADLSGSQLVDEGVIVDMAHPGGSFSIQVDDAARMSTIAGMKPTQGREFVDITVTIANSREAKAVVANPSFFTVTTADSIDVAASPITAKTAKPCTSDIAVSMAGQYSCHVAFEIPVGALPVKLGYRDDSTPARTALAVINMVRDTVYQLLTGTYATTGSWTLMAGCGVVTPTVPMKITVAQTMPPSYTFSGFYNGAPQAQFDFKGTNDAMAPIAIAGVTDGAGCNYDYDGTAKMHLRTEKWFTVSVVINRKNPVGNCAWAPSCTYGWSQDYGGP